MSDISQANYGKSAFSAEELAAEAAAEQKRKDEFEAKMNNGFFQDGLIRKVVFDNIEKEAKTSKAGNPYTLHTYLIRDLETGQKELHVDRNFAMTNAFDPIKKQLGTEFRYGLTVMELAARPDFPKSVVIAALYREQGAVEAARGSSVIDAGTTVLLVGQRDEVSDVITALTAPA